MKSAKDIFQRKYLRVAALYFGVLAILIIVVFAGYVLAYRNKVYPNQYLGETSLGGMRKSALEELVKTRADTLLDSKIVLKHAEDGTDYSINPAEIGLNFDKEATVEHVWSVGRDGRVYVAIKEKLKALFGKDAHTATIILNEEGLGKKITEISSKLDQPERDFSLVYNDGKFGLNSDRVAGQRIDQLEIINTIRTELKKLKAVDLAFELKDYAPQITEENAQKALDRASRILDAGELTLKSDTASFQIDRDTIGGFIISKSNGDDLNLVLNSDRVTAYVTALAKSIDVAPRDAKLNIADGKVNAFQTSQVGKSLDTEQARRDIENTLFARILSGSVIADTSVITLKINTKQPDVSSDTISQYGLVELVGSATTSFVGSPSNRVHNINLGASAINGVLLKPGEEFSTLGRLGVIDGSTGYLEELVIKDNKTIPEFGGGLCQVSTTLFRAAMNSGMKITARANHAYRVSYYEPPAGMDATIYDPAPDFKFVNNFGSYILIQSKVVGTKITFDFYGTKDGRKITQSTPVMSNIVEPPPAVTVVSDTLAPGERKQTGKPHQGATVDFTYTVNSASGELLQEKKFHSVYNAIPEQWLAGPDLPPAAPAAEVPVQ